MRHTQQIVMRPPSAWEGTALTIVKDCAKSIGFLLENAGPVIQYRLRKEILHDMPQAEEARLIGQIAQLPYFKLAQSYTKPNGYIGSGMHSWDNWRGRVLHQTPLEDGESAARLLSYYRIPKDSQIVRDFVAVMRDEAMLREEFSYIPPEATRFENRFVGLNNGNCLMAMLFTMQAMLGYGDDYDDLIAFQQIALKGFRRALAVSSVADFTTFRPRVQRKYSYPYMDADEYFPDVYTLSMLAYTLSWRSNENTAMLAQAFDHINAIMRPDTNIHVKIGSKYYAPCFALVRPIRAFDAALIDVITYRRILTEIAMLGVGERAEVIRRSVANVLEALDGDGILRLRFDLPHNTRCSPKYIQYPGAYTDVRLEADYSQPYALLCDLTFWAVEFLYLAGGGSLSN